MKKIIIGLGIALLAIGVYFSNSSDGQHNTKTKTKVIVGSGALKNTEDDQQNTLETNKEIAIQLGELSRSLTRLAAEVEVIKSKSKSDKQKSAINGSNAKYLINNKVTNTKINPVDVVKSVVDQVVNVAKNSVTNGDLSGLSNVPIGGADDLGVNGSSNGLSHQKNNSTPTDGWVWQTGQNSATNTHLQTRTKGLDNSSPLLPKTQNIIAKYTIPANTFLKATLKTKLLGRIPVSGKVEDPYRFVIDVSDRALFASFKSHKDLIGIRMSGLAQGDLLLSCAKGSVDSITFIFTDETIAQYNGVDLAIITDKYGQPCINGELITNAPKTLSISAGLSTLSSIADAFAQTEQSTTQDSSGNSQQVLTGDAKKFALNKGISGGLSSVNNWVADRARSSFDVIKVDSGVEVVLLTRAEIPIDYNPNGRKLRHNQTNNNEYNKQLD